MSDDEFFHIIWTYVKLLFVVWLISLIKTLYFRFCIQEMPPIFGYETLIAAIIIQLIIFGIPEKSEIADYAKTLILTIIFTGIAWLCGTPVGMMFMFGMSR